MGVIANIDTSGLEDYSSNIKNYVDGLSLNNIGNCPKDVGTFIARLNAKIYLLENSINVYSNHITSSMNKLNEIEQTIGKNFENRLSESEELVNLLSTNRVGNNSLTFGFDDDTYNAIKKVISNVESDEEGLLFDGVDDKLSEELKFKISKIYTDYYNTSDSDNFEDYLWKALNGDNSKNVFNIQHNSDDLAKKTQDLIGKNNFTESEIISKLKEEGYNDDEINSMLNYNGDADFAKDYFDELISSNSQQGNPSIPSSSEKTTPGSSTNPNPGNKGVVPIPDDSVPADQSFEQNSINFAKNPNNDLFTYYENDNLSSSNDVAYIRLKEGATFSKIQHFFGDVPGENITCYNVKTGKEEKITDPNWVYASDDYIYIIKK